jgi:hypothetical protein
VEEVVHDVKFSIFNFFAIGGPALRAIINEFLMFVATRCLRVASWRRGLLGGKGGRQREERRQRCLAIVHLYSRFLHFPQYRVRVLRQVLLLLNLSLQ